MCELIIEGIRHSFNNVQIVNCDFTRLEPGKVTGIVGRNGCGKSTLFKSLYGVLNADYHRILYRGKVVKNLYTMKGAAAYLDQDNFLPRFLTIQQFLKISGLTKEKQALLKERFKDLLKSKIISLSGGERRLLEIHYILGLERDFTFMDEPLIGLEPHNTEEVQELIQQHKGGILLTSHLYRDMKDVMENVFLMKHGTLVPVESESDLIKMGYLPKTYR